MLGAGKKNLFVNTNLQAAEKPKVSNLSPGKFGRLLLQKDSFK